jgi:hypothetical protein
VVATGVEQGLSNFVRRIICESTYYLVTVLLLVSCLDKRKCYCYLLAPAMTIMQARLKYKCARVACQYLDRDPTRDKNYTLKPSTTSQKFVEGGGGRNFRTPPPPPQCSTHRINLGLVPPCPGCLVAMEDNTRLSQWFLQN